jgi:hypothetical protein
VGGRHLYIVFDTKLASQIYRRSSTFIFDPFSLMISRALGSTKEDVAILQMGAKVLERPDDYVDDGRRVILDVHHMAQEHLSGDSLNTMTAKFIEFVVKDIDNRFPADKIQSYDWIDVEFTDFVKKVWTEAGVPALFGTKLLEAWPDMYTWFWKFDRNIQKFVKELPTWVNPNTHALKEAGIKHFETWEQTARTAAKEGEMEDMEWDPYWGLRFSKVRIKYFEAKGISPRGRAVQSMAMFWA